MKRILTSSTFLGVTFSWGVLIVQLNLIEPSQ